MPKRKKYSFIYSVYRKIRYLRYVRKLRKAAVKQAKHEERKLHANSRKNARAHSRVESRAEAERKRHAKKQLKEEQARLNEEYEQDQINNRHTYESEKADRIALILKEKRFRKYRRRRLFRLYIKTCRRNVILSIKTLNPANFPVLIRHIRDNKISIREFAVISAHSTLFFMAAYFLVFAIMLFTSALSGIFFDYTSVVYYYEVLWIVKPEEWFGDSVKMIYASGPILSGILAVFFAIIFSYIRTERGLGKLFVLWFFIHAFNAFFGSLLIGSLFGRGFGYAIIWSFISDTEKVIYSIVSITILFLLGVFTTRSFLISANSYYPHLEKQQQQKFVWAQVILPFVIGNIFIGMIMFPELLWYDMTVALSMALVIIPVAIGYRFLPSLYFEEETSKTLKLRFVPVLLSLIFIILFRIILGYGIKVG